MADAKKYEYAVNEVPPIGHLLLSAFQHVLIMVVAIGIPIIFAGQLNETPAFTASLVTFSMLASGIGSIIQALRLPYLGSGYLCPNLCGPSYLSLSLSAAWIGGLPLMRGITIVAGLIEMFLAPVIQKMKSIFPIYVVGLVVALVGISIVQISVTSFFGLTFQGDAVRNMDIFIGAVSLFIMVFCNIWGKGFVKIYCLIIGMFSGWILAMILIPEYWQNLLSVQNNPLFAMPHFHSLLHPLSFRVDLLIPLIVIAIGSTLKTFGNLLAAQKMSEPELNEVNFVPIRNGIIADGLATTISGLMGSMAVDTSSSNIGLAGATKVLSRWISVVAGTIFILLAFFPMLTNALSLIPKPVLGASLIFSGCFMICAGLIQMLEDKWDQRKTFVVGIALFFGLSTAFLPSLYARVPKLIQTFFTDPLPTATILAVILNQLFNLDRLFEKIRKRD
ncbi:MAG TPA: solute carrier family 23 protein [Smithella sp.]|nr:solute carrier family 23 protein [Smithella sp.]HOG91147.1 solute carrier family 23 protein [Smithella sp.]